MNEVPPKKVVIQFICDSDTEIIINLKDNYKNKQDQHITEAIENGAELEHNDEDEYVKKDPVRKFQFDHNVSTCLTNRFP